MGGVCLTSLRPRSPCPDSTVLGPPPPDLPLTVTPSPLLLLKVPLTVPSSLQGLTLLHSLLEPKPPLSYHPPTTTAMSLYSRNLRLTLPDPKPSLSSTTSTSTSPTTSWSSRFSVPDHPLGVLPEHVWGLYHTSPSSRPLPRPPWKILPFGPKSFPSFLTKCNSVPLRPFCYSIHVKTYVTRRPCLSDHE